MPSPSWLTLPTPAQMLEAAALWTVDRGPDERRFLAAACCRLALLVLTPKDVEAVTAFCEGNPLAEDRCMCASVALSKEMGQPSAYDFMRVMSAHDLAGAVMDPKLARIGTLLCLLAVPWVNDEELPTVAGGVATFVAAVFPGPGEHVSMPGWVWGEARSGFEEEDFRAMPRDVFRAMAINLIRMEWHNSPLSAEKTPTLAGASADSTDSSGS